MHHGNVSHKMATMPSAKSGRRCKRSVVDITWERTDWTELGGAEYQGSFMASRGVLEEIFGLPLLDFGQGPDRGAESTTEWILRRSDGRVIRIYDHNIFDEFSGDLRIPALNQVYSWRVDGVDPDDARWVNTMVLAHLVSTSDPSDDDATQATGTLGYSDDISAWLLRLLDEESDE